MMYFMDVYGVDHMFHTTSPPFFTDDMPRKQRQAALEKLHQLPAASVKTWTKTSEAYGEQFKEHWRLRLLLRELVLQEGGHGKRLKKERMML
jgi:hypothetical protein